MIYSRWCVCNMILEYDYDGKVETFFSAPIGWMWDGSEGRPVGESLLWCANWVCEWFSLDEMLGPRYWVSSTAQTMFSVSKEIQTHPNFSSDDGGVPIPYNKKPIGNPRCQWQSFIMLNLLQHGRIFNRPYFVWQPSAGRLRHIGLGYRAARFQKFRFKKW